VSGTEVIVAVLGRVDDPNPRFTALTLRPGGCGSFYAILISSPEFKGLSMVKQHKLVNDCLKEDIAGIHGLQVSGVWSCVVSRLVSAKSKTNGNNQEC
jgi:stress-induced morphogen